MPWRKHAMEKAENTRVTLKRGIGLFDATTIGIGAIIGGGIFVVTGIAAGLAGPALIISMVISAAIASLTAFSFSKLSMALPKEGGVYGFAYEYISPFAGFTAGWMWIFSNIFVGAAVSLGFASYFAALFPSLSIKLVAIVVCLFFTIFNIIGIRQSALLNSILVSAKILILLFFIAFGIFYVNGSNFVPFTPNGSFGVLQGSALIFFAYAGFARITILAEEVKDPSRTIPRSILIALGVSTSIYLLTSFVAVGLIGYVNLSASGSPLVNAIGVTGSRFAMSLISVGAIMATASVLLTTILGVSRVVFAMARNNDLPKFLCNIHSKFKTPYYSVAVTGSFMILAIVFTDFARIVAVSSFAVLLYYSLANLAAIKLSGRKNHFSIISSIGLFSCLGLLVFLTIDSWIIGTIGIAIGIVFYQAWRKIKRQ
jgi:APA family basic amino acid/polyamine antiporter